MNTHTSTALTTCVSVTMADTRPGIATVLAAVSSDDFPHLVEAFTDATHAHLITVHVVGEPTTLGDRG
ncbi:MULTISPECIES: hypothetical protein [Mycobacteriaceae]|uniref:hypothetical protein n=1 Tax=Mycobacterium sp. 852002-51961_SCH5331710 TaxID=1834105 RepID=UPI0007FE12E9|nr:MULTISPECIES: hypothetical protein [Mycobacteriaceae]OBB47948.1 hypothetical protein A5752_22620 [Mycobacterium sp. 852002-51961_SCH5331710]